MKIEFCCEKMMDAIALGDLAVENLKPHGLYYANSGKNILHWHRLLNQCPYCGTRIEITVRGEDNEDKTTPSGI